MTDRDSGHDVVVVGSGVAGLTAAATTVAAGAPPLVVEASQLWGGTSALSAGGRWVPDNHLMRADRVQDSADEAARYLGEVIGDVGPASSAERRRAYAENARPWLVSWASRGSGGGGPSGGRTTTPNCPDRGSDGCSRGCPSTSAAWARRPENMRLPETIPPVPLQGGDLADIALGVRSLRGIKAGARTLARAATGLARNQRLVCMGSRWSRS